MNGYPSKEPCIVCGSHEQCLQEPRFGYTVCKDHYNVPPIKIALNRDHEQTIDECLATLNKVIKRIKK